MFFEKQTFRVYNPSSGLRKPLCYAMVRDGKGRLRASYLNSLNDRTDVNAGFASRTLTRAEARLISGREIHGMNQHVS